MIRTQVYLPRALYRRIQLKAQQDGKPAAQVMRELLESGLTGDERETTGDALLRLAAVGAPGPSDLSQRIDDYLYADTTG